MIYKKTFGTPEEYTPSKFKEPSRVEISKEPAPLSVKFSVTNRGCKMEIPLAFGEEIFGFGLQLKSFNHKGSKKRLCPNADPITGNGDSHAPVPFYVTTKGYGVLVDTARYVSFYCGYARNKNRPPVPNNTVITSTRELYEKSGLKEETAMIIDIPVAEGIDLYIFKGESITEVVEQYNLFSGGGVMPPLWGLGMFYRCYAKNTDEKVLKTAQYFRDHHIPCDIIGLEPGWQSSSYACSYVWDNERFPKYREMISKLKEQHFHINLWEHAFVNSVSPIYEKLRVLSGSFEVWQGITPDFADESAVKIFADYHRDHLVKLGITGFKLDECDGSDHTGGWSFPDCEEFPSGVDGEQMHCLIGNLYQRTILKALGNQRTLSEVRSAGAFASPYPFVLYSDLYDHKDFIRGLVNAGFSGLLWTPEVRNTNSREDLIRRLQTVIFSPQALVNAWYMEMPPWLKFDAEDEVKELFKLRMSLIPYLYTAFYYYYKEGRPPVRAVVSDYTEDEQTYELDDEYLMGDCMLVAPITAKEEGRKVYLPYGIWYDFWTNEKYENGWHEIVTENIPVFVKSGSIIPLAKPIEYLTKDTIIDITLKCYSDGGKFLLVEDNGETYDTEFKAITVDQTSNIISKRYKITSIIQIK